MVLRTGANLAFTKVASSNLEPDTFDITTTLKKVKFASFLSPTPSVVYFANDVYNVIDVYAGLFGNLRLVKNINSYGLGIGYNYETNTVYDTIEVYAGLFGNLRLVKNVNSYGLGVGENYETNSFPVAFDTLYNFGRVTKSGELGTVPGALSFEANDVIIPISLEHLLTYKTIKISDSNRNFSANGIVDEYGRVPGATFNFVSKARIRTSGQGPSEIKWDSRPSYTFVWS